jgi:hypothetical protein
MPEGITHKNKDVLFKVLSQHYPNKSFAVYGLNVPRIKKLLPSTYPVVTAKEIYSDNVFLLVDGSILILEYESAVSIKNFLKYTKYIVSVAELLMADGVSFSKIILAVIYTGDVNEAEAEYDIGALKIQTEQIFLSGFDTEGIYGDLKRKIEAKEPLSDDDLMRLIILSLTQPDKERKQLLARDCVNLAKQLQDDKQMTFAIAGILTATNKFIGREYSNSIKEWLRMTYISRLYEEEKIEAVNAAHYKDMCRVATDMLRDGDDILKAMRITKLTREQIERAWEEANAIAV